jgi:hypothetical protein
MNTSSDINHLLEIARQIDKQVRRIRWTNEELEEKFGRRSANQILAEGNTFYMNSCMDLTLASILLAQRKGLNPDLVIEEHGKTRGVPFNRAHFVLELPNNGGAYLNPKTLGLIQIGQGKYPGRQDIPKVRTLRVDGSRIDPSRPLYQNLGFTSLEEALKKLFIGYDIKPNIEKIKRDNTLNNYLRYKRIAESPLRITLI